MLSTVEETCRCGAEFKVTGKETHCSFRYQEFLNAHKKCRQNDDEDKSEDKSCCESCGQEIPDCRS